MGARFFVMLFFVTLAHAQVRPTGTHKDEKPVEKTKIELPKQDDRKLNDPFFQQQTATSIIAENRNKCGEMIKAENAPLKNINDVHRFIHSIQAEHIIESIPEINEQKFTYHCDKMPVVVDQSIKCLLSGSEEMIDGFVKNKKSLEFLQQEHKMSQEDAQQLINLLEYLNTPLLKEKRLLQKK